MLDGPKADSVDRLLDELEALATSSAHSSEFYRQLLLRVNFLLDAEGSAIIIPARDASWLMLASSGEVDAQELRQLCLHLDELTPSVDQLDQPARGLHNSRILQSVGNHYWIGAPLRTNSWKQGGLVASLSIEPPKAALPGLGELVSAMAEISAIRQIRTLEKFLDERWYRLQQAIAQVSVADSKQDAACLLVNELLGVIGADRISLFEKRGFDGSRCLAVSGIEAIDRRAATVAEIERFANIALRDGSVVARREPDESQSDTSPIASQPTLGNALALPFSSAFSVKSTERTAPSSHSSSGNLDSVLVIEWASRERFYEAAPLLRHLLPSFEHAWREHRRWDRIPKWFRTLADRRFVVFNWLSWRSLRWAGWLLLATGLAVAAQLPQTLKIEASGRLEPVEQRVIFATADGYIDQLLVEEGEAVQLGQLVAVVRSPNLAMQIQEFEGELLTLAEKRSGLQIAVNQLSPEDPAVAVTQSRLSAEIREIDTRIENVHQLVAVLKSESHQLELRSPIRGVIVATELRRNLQSRPIRRGDALLRVVALDGPWRLELEVPDRDSAYVRTSYPLTAGPSNSATPERKVDFVLAANPKQRFSGDVEWISNATRNPRGTGAYVDVHVRVAREVSDQGHTGSTVLAYFSCGEYPWWFVWSRPLVEAVQRRMWF